MPDALQDPLEGPAVEFLVVYDENVCFAQGKFLRETAEGGRRIVETPRGPFKPRESGADTDPMASPDPYAASGERVSADEPVLPFVLVVDDEPLLLRSLRRILTKAGYRTALAESAEAAEPLLAAPDLGVVLTDVALGRESGLAMLERIKRERSEVEVIVMTGDASPESEAGCLRLGAFDYFAKPFDDVLRFRNSVGKALEHCALVQRNRTLERELAKRDRALRLAASVETPDAAGSNLSVSLAAYERCALERALWESGGDASAAAARLGIGRSTFYRKLARHNISPIREGGGRPNSMG